MELGLDYRTAMRTALDAARAVEAATARAAHRAEDAFEGARMSGDTDVQAAAEHFRACHRAYVDARTEVAELEAALEEGTEERLAA